jgi:predicted transcriptional regulator of viral defense system
MKHVKDIRKRFANPSFPVFKASELRTMGVGKKYSKRLLHLLLSKGEIARITRGIYTFHDDVTVVGFAFQPFYYGLEDALRIRRLSLQGTNPLVLTARNVRMGVRQFKGRNYVVYRVRKEHFFGYSLVKYGDFWIPVSDIEKTIIDMIYFDNGIRDELWPGLIKSMNIKNLNRYLKRYKPKFRERVLAEVGKMKGVKLPKSRSGR